MGNCHGCSEESGLVKSGSGSDIQMVNSRRSSPVRKSVGSVPDGTGQRQGSPSPTRSHGASSDGGSPTSTTSSRARMGSRTSFRSIMSGMVHNVMKKKEIIPVHICKLCQQSLREGENICHCLIEEMYPNNRETNKQIREQYLQNNELIHNVTHLDQHPEKLVKFVEEVYHIIEKSSMKEDLSPASMAKAKENLVNHLCTHLDEIIVEEN